MNAPAFDNSFAKLPEQFYTRLEPTPVREPRLLRLNEALALELGLDTGWLRSEAGVAMLAGNRLPQGADPLASVYAGHQFGSYNPRLGDGRALLLGEVTSPEGRRYDVQLKGSGPTPYSRGGDGRSPLGPVLREYIISEAMASFGVPTTRALAAVATGEPVYRERAEPGAILTRVAASHLRVGTVQYFAARGEHDSLSALVGHVLERHYPELVEAELPALALLEAVLARQAALIASWQHLGFIHGVMNTDNMLLCGETIDYGPCAFMDSYHPETVYSSIDHAGRYAYRNQPAIAHWNLTCLAQALLPLIDADRERAVARAQAVVDTFPERFTGAWRAGLARKLGLVELEERDDAEVESLFGLMTETRCDFTLGFRYLGERLGSAAGTTTVEAFWKPPEALEGWCEGWLRRLGESGVDTADSARLMLASNPLFIPRNHLVQAAIEAAEAQDYSVFNRLVMRLSAPCADAGDDTDLALPPRPEQVVHRTFCGT